MLQTLRGKRKFIRLLVQRISKFKINEIQCKTPQ